MRGFGEAEARAIVGGRVLLVTSNMDHHLYYMRMDHAEQRIMAAHRLVTLSKCRATTYGVFLDATLRDGAGFAQDVVTRLLPRITRRGARF